MGKLQFHRKVEKDSMQKDKTFSQRINNNRKHLFVRNSSNSRDRENSKGNFAKSSSDQEHKVNALASGADEGRDKLRKAAVSCK